LYFNNSLFPSEYHDKRRKNRTIPAGTTRRRYPAMIVFPIKLAVASKEGMAISEHFGHAKQFRIYEATPD